MWQVLFYISNWNQVEIHLFQWYLYDKLVSCAYFSWSQSKIQVSDVTRGFFFGSYLLFDSRWMKKRRKLDCIFFPTDSFQVPSFGYCWWRFRCFKQKQQKGTSFKLTKMLISLKTKIYIYQLWRCLVTLTKKPCTFF